MTDNKIRALSLDEAGSIIKQKKSDFMTKVLNLRKNDEYLRFLIARNGNIEHLDMLLDDKSFMVRIEIAKRGIPKYFEALRKDQNSLVRHWALSSYTKHVPIEHDFVHEDDFVGAFNSGNPFLIKQAIENLTDEIVAKSENIKEYLSIYASFGRDY